MRPQGVRVSPGGPRGEWGAHFRDTSSTRDVYDEWGVDCRDQPEAFACILSFESKGDAVAYGEMMGRPVLQRRTVVTRNVGEWEPTE